MVLNESADTCTEICCCFTSTLPAVITPYKKMVASWDIHAPRETSL